MMTTIPTLTDTPHLWEVDHPYYAEDGCFYTPGTRWAEVHTEYDSWADFAEGWGDTDPDLNLVYRWDWNRPDPDDWTYEIENDPGFVMPGDTLHIYFMLQRKAKPHSIVIQITEADEPAVRAWLTERAKTVRAIWSPILDEAGRLEEARRLDRNPVAKAAVARASEEIDNAVPVQIDEEVGR